MPHDQVGVETQRSVEHDLSRRVNGSFLKVVMRTRLSFGCSDHRRQPPALSRVHKLEYDIMFVHQFLQPRDICFGLCQRGRIGWDRVSGHGYSKGMAR